MPAFREGSFSVVYLPGSSQLWRSLSQLPPFLTPSNCVKTAKLRRLQPVENHTFQTPLGAMPSRTTPMNNAKTEEHRKKQLITYFLHAQKNYFHGKKGLVMIEIEFLELLVTKYEKTSCWHNQHSIKGNVNVHC